MPGYLAQTEVNASAIIIVFTGYMVWKLPALSCIITAPVIQMIIRIRTGNVASQFIPSGFPA